MSHSVKSTNKQKKLALRRKAEKKQAQLIATKKNALNKEEQIKKVQESYRSCSKHPLKALEEIYKSASDSFNVPPTHGMPHIASVFNMVRTSHYPKEVADSLYRILKHMMKLDVNFFDVAQGTLRSNISRALTDISQHKDKWLREPEGWKPTSHNSYRQFSSFLRHLFAKYPMPVFMDDAWFHQNKIHQSWFIHMGVGQNIRTASNLPLPLTSKMAHHFCQAPPDFDVISAIRWGQLRAMGADERTIKATLSTRIGGVFTNNDFWSTVFAWFIANPMLDKNQYAPIIDYFQYQKYTPSIMIGDTRVPAQPNLSMNKRTVDATLKQVEEWHKRLGHERKAGNLEWLPSGIPPLHHIEGDGEHRVIYETVELLTSKSLKEEGSRMHHCVASYSQSCASRQISIWSLQSTDWFLNKRKLLTIEVSNQNNTIRQARGSYNEVASGKEIQIIHLWAKKAGLNVARWMI